MNTRTTTPRPADAPGIRTSGPPAWPAPEADAGAGEAGSDARVRRDCQRAIDAVGTYPDVQILVRQGWVSLRGAVLQGADRWKVEQAVFRVPGVVGADAQLSVR